MYHIGMKSECRFVGKVHNDQRLETTLDILDYAWTENFNVEYAAYPEYHYYHNGQSI